MTAVDVDRRPAPRPVPSSLPSSARATADLPETDRQRKIRASAIGVGIGAVSFLLALWNLGIRPLRTAGRNNVFGHFYDIQARAFLDGDLALPQGALSFEAFRHDGHDYLYFGPLPALLRLPLLAVTDRFDGELTTLSILAAWVVAAVMVALTVWRVRAVVAPDRELTQTDLVAAGGLIAAITGGSALLLLGAIPWIYSEALIWAVAMSLGAIFAAVGVLERPTTRRLLLAATFVLGAALTRVTAGWGTGLTLVAIAVMFAVAPRHRHHRQWALATFCAAAVPLLVGVAVNWAKFRQPVMIPFEDQVWTELSARRRRVLDEGGVVGLRFLPSTILSYLRPDGLRFSHLFPFVSAPSELPTEVGGVFIDMRYRTPSATATMPLLWVLALVGSALTFRPRAGAGYALLRVPVLGAVSILTGVLSVGYIAPRYLAEFVPFLALASAVGTFGLLQRLPRWRLHLVKAAVGAAGALVAFGIVVNMGIAVTTARVAAGGSSLRDYVAMQNWISERTGDPIAAGIETGDTLTDASRPDHVRIIGDCDALYYGTGERFEPWIPFEFRDIHIRITFDDVERSGEPSRIALVNYDGPRDRSIDLEFDEAGNYRLVLTSGLDEQAAFGPWKQPHPDLPVDLWVVADFDYGGYLVTAPGQLYTWLTSNELQPDLTMLFGVARTAEIDGSAAARLGVDVTVSREPASGLCRELLGGR